MTLLGIFRPGGKPRVGILGIATTRGDRLFISLLGSAFIHLAWLGPRRSSRCGGLLASRSSMPLGVFRFV
jgi:predicted small integral membrane protein